MSVRPPMASAILSFAFPINIRRFTFSFTRSFNGVKSPPLSSPPAIRITGSENPSNDFTTAPTFVPLESFIYLTSSIIFTSSSLCSSPLNFFSTGFINSTGHPDNCAAAIDAIAFSILCTPFMPSSSVFITISSLPLIFETISAHLKYTPLSTSFSLLKRIISAFIFFAIPAV